MDITKLSPILNKESILKTANAVELRENPQDVLQRYHTYAMTHVPLGNTTKQLDDLERVVVENKTCAIGTIVGPYGYGKTSTAVHLWNETRGDSLLRLGTMNRAAKGWDRWIRPKWKAWSPAAP